eukprot:COSAG02_NODE_15261_length_1188_cov_3.610652_2_plen_67_part_00
MPGYKMNNVLERGHKAYGLILCVSYALFPLTCEMKNADESSQQSTATRFICEALHLVCPQALVNSL